MKSLLFLALAALAFPVALTPASAVDYTPGNSADYTPGVAAVSYAPLPVSNLDTNPDWAPNRVADVLPLTPKPPQIAQFAPGQAIYPATQSFAPYVLTPSYALQCDQSGCRYVQASPGGGRLSPFRR